MGSAGAGIGCRETEWHFNGARRVLTGDDDEDDSDDDGDDDGDHDDSVGRKLSHQHRRIFGGGRIQSSYLLRRLLVQVQWLHFDVQFHASFYR